MQALTPALRPVQATTSPAQQPPQDATAAASELAPGAGQTAAAPPAITRAPSARGTVAAPPQVALLLSRASEMLALGDLSAARLLYRACRHSRQRPGRHGAGSNL